MNAFQHLGILHSVLFFTVLHHHVHKHLGKDRHIRSKAGHPLATSAQHVQNLDCGQHSIPGCIPIKENNMAGLLSAKHKPALAHALHHIAVADRGLFHMNPKRAHALF